MKKYLLLVIILAAILGGIAQISAQDKKKELPVSLHRTETIEMKSVSNGAVYPVYIALPGSYYTSDKTYPVVYMLDAYSSFGVAVQMARLLASSKELPEVIIVGISSEGGSKEFIYNRARDYTPSMVEPGKLSEYARAMTPASGGAGSFLNFIGNELIQRIESTYRTIPGDRTLAGHSYGGLFVFYALFEKPELFNRYIMISPALQWDDDLMLKIEDGYSKNHKSLKASVYTAMGSLETADFIQSWKKLIAKMKARKYEGLRLEDSLIENETHYSMIPHLATHGLKYIFSTERIN